MNQDGRVQKGDVVGTIGKMRKINPREGERDGDRGRVLIVDEREGEDG